MAQVPGWLKLRDPPAEGTYVGAAQPGSDPYLAFVVQRDHIVIYVCDGEKIGSWFGGTVAGGKFDVRDREGIHVKGALTQGRVEGTLIRPGQSPRSYVAEPARQGRTGLFVGKPQDEDVVHRWIVLARGVRGTGRGGVNPVSIQTSPATTSTGAFIAQQVAEVDKLQDAVAKVQATVNDAEGRKDKSGTK